jgi:hypothetical protein
MTPAARSELAAAAIARVADHAVGDERAALRWAADVIATVGTQCTCTPGVPLSSGHESVDDLVTIDETDDPDHARLVRAAATAALDAGVEPGIRRARWIDGWMAGHRAITS